VQYIFKTATDTTVDPGTGVVRFNNATQASTTQISLDDVPNGAAASCAAWIATWDDSTSTVRGYISIVQPSAPSNYRIFQLTSVVTQTGFSQLNVTNIAGGGSFANNAILQITPYRTGDQGSAGASATIAIGDSPPGSPADSTLWWNTTDGVLYIYYNDGNTSQWVTATAAPTDTSRAPVDSPTFTGDPKAPTPATGDNDTSVATTAFVQDALLRYFEPYGLQINGGMEVSQFLGVTPTSTPGYVIDCWDTSKQGTMVFSIGQVVGSPNYVLQAGITTAQAVIGSTDYCLLEQRIEGLRVNRLNWGAASAIPITISFWSQHHRTGTYSGSVRNSAANRSYTFTYQQNAADVAEYKTVTIPGDTTGTWLKDTSIGIIIDFALAGGSTFLTAAGAWTAGNFIGATGQINGVAATSDIFRIFGVTVFPGSYGPTAAQQPLIMRPVQEELLICQRYWETIQAAWAGNTSASGVYNVICNYKNQKRIAPTITSSQSPLLNGGFGARTMSVATTNYVSWGGNSPSAVTSAGFSDTLFVDARL